MTLDRLLRGDTARWLLRAATRDLTRHLQAGGHAPDAAADVLAALEQAAKRHHHTVTAATGTSPASLGRVGSARDAADLTGRSVRWITELARTGQVRALRVGARTWSIDLDSAVNVCGRRERRDGRHGDNGRGPDDRGAGSGRG